MSKKKIETPPITVIKDFNVSISHGVNYKINQKEADIDEPVFNFHTDLERIAEILKSKDRKDYQLKLELTARESYRGQHESTIEFWCN